MYIPIIIFSNEFSYNINSYILALAENNKISSSSTILHTIVFTFNTIYSTSNHSTIL